MGLFDWFGRLFGDGSSVPDVRHGETGDVDAAAPPAEQAATLVEAVAGDGYELDYSPESLTSLDSLAEDLSEEGAAALSRPIVAYLGEVFVRNYDGEWRYTEEIGWLVDLEATTVHEEDDLFAVPHAVNAVMEGDETFASVHDQAVAGLDVDGPSLGDEPIDVPAGQAGDPVDDAIRQEYRALASELVDSWAGYDLDYTRDSLSRIDELVADHYDRTPEGVDRDARLSESPPGVVPEGATLTFGTGGATAKIAAYVGEVFSRTYGGGWREGEVFDSMVTEVAAGELEIDPEQLVNAAYDGYVSFERLHEKLAAEHELPAGE